MHVSDMDHVDRIRNNIPSINSSTRQDVKAKSLINFKDNKP